MLQIKSDIASSLSELMSSLFAEDILAGELASMLEYPPDSTMGDIALPCFKLSKRLRRSPAVIADTLAQGFSCTCVEGCSAKSGYLNFKLSADTLTSRVNYILSTTDCWATREGEGKTVVIDYSAPNIAKPFHIGHLRSTVIGAVRHQRILELQGYKVIGINHLGDWGTQFGRQMVAYKRWGNREDVDNRGIAALVELYVRFHKELDNEPSLADEARAWFTKLEQRDAEALELWQWFYDISMKEMRSIYKRLGVDFEYYTGESYYTDKMPEIVDMLRNKGLLKQDDGAMLVDLEQYGSPPCLILKRDGSTLYPTRDIAAAFYRKRTFNFHKAIYVTAAPQNLHFAQWFKVIELMGEDWG
ncbi:MAG: arginine--tRNA ligase [Eubacteriales bacterium]